MENKLFILISTLDDRVINLENIIQVPNPTITYIISHQINKNLNTKVVDYIDKLIERKDIIYLVLNNKGVAKNRNNILNNIKASSLCLILDDDVLLRPNTYQDVITAFQDNPTAEFISFKILNLDGSDYKTYPKTKQWHTLQTLTGIGTTEIAFRSDCILQHNIKFDERFGPGADKYPLGEDFIFVMDLYYKKLRMLFLPISIVKHPLNSTGANLDKEIIFSRGAVFARIFGKKAYFLDIFFTIKHKKMYQNRYSMFTYFKLMILGSYNFLKNEK